MIYNHIPVSFGALRVITGPTISYQYDTVQLLVFSDIDLPDYYTVDFCNTGDSETTTITGTPDGVRIPDELLLTGRDIKAYVVLTGTDEGAVETRYEITLPVRNRPMRQGIEPTPEERLEIETLVNALNDGVSRAETAADEAEQAAELLANPSAEATTLEPGSEATAEYADGVFSFGIPKGQKGDKLTYADLTEEDKADLVQGPILEAQTEAVNAVNAAGTRNVNSVNTAGTTNVNSVNSAGTTQVGNVNQAGATQVQAVEDKGAEVIRSIPADYTELDAKVTSLNQAINVLDAEVNDSTTGLDTKAPAIINTASGAIASFSDGADGMPVKKLVVSIEPVQAGSGGPSPDNIRPISGWTGAEIEGTGVNVWDEEWELGGLNSSNGANWNTNTRIRSKNYIPIKPNTDYYISYPAYGVAADYCFYDANKEFISSSSFVNRVITSQSNAYFMRFSTYAQYGTTYNHDISINYPATDTAYHAYTGSQISITFPSEAGTVYGGTLTINPDRTGTLVVDRAIYTPVISNVISRDNAAQATCGSIAPDNSIPYNAQDICTAAKYSASAYPGNFYGTGTNFVLFGDTSLDTKEKWITYIAESNYQICYVLATPITYTLTASEIDGILETLYGTNNIWADCGDIEKLTYRADLGKYIDSHITTAVANALNA